MPRKRPDRYHHGDLSRSLLQEALRTIEKGGVAALTLRSGRGEAGRLTHGTVPAFCRQVCAARRRRDRGIPYAAPGNAARLGRAGGRPQGARGDGRGLRAVCRGSSVALSRDVRRVRAQRGTRLGSCGGRGWRVSGAGGRDRGPAEGRAGAGGQPARARAIYLGQRARHCDAGDRRPAEAAD